MKFIKLTIIILAFCINAFAQGVKDPPPKEIRKPQKRKIAYQVPKSAVVKAASTLKLQNQEAEIIKEKSKIAKELQMADVYFENENYSKAIEIYNKYYYSILDDIQQNRLGYLYCTGSGVSQDFSKAKFWFENASLLGNSEAMNNFGILLLYGYGVEQNTEKAKYWLEKGVELGDDNSMNTLGIMY
jgi:TPR repeat protein